MPFLGGGIRNLHNVLSGKPGEKKAAKRIMLKCIFKEWHMKMENGYL